MTEKRTRVSKWVTRAKNHPIVAVVIVLGVVVIAISHFTNAIQDIYSFVARLGSGGTAEETSQSTPTSITANDIDYDPIWFDKNDRSIENWHKFDLPRRAGSSIHIGNCPDEPCIIFTVESVSLPPDDPVATIAVGIASGHLTTSGTTPLRFPIPLKRGCGGCFRSHICDFCFEIIDDRVASITAVLAFFPGTREEAEFYIDSTGCR